MTSQTSHHQLPTVTCFFCVIGTTELHYTQYTLIKHPEKEHHIHLVLARYRIRCAGHTALKWNVSESATIPKKSSSRRSRSRAAFCPPNSASYDIFSVRSPTEWWIWLRFKIFVYIYTMIGVPLSCVTKWLSKKGVKRTCCDYVEPASQY